MEENTEKKGVLTVEQAIQIARIIAYAPDKRLAMVVAVLQKANLDFEELEEWTENGIPLGRRQLLDLDEFVRQLVEGREPHSRGYLFTADEFNGFCLKHDLQPRLVKRQLYAAGYIEREKTGDGKTVYSVRVRENGELKRVIAVKTEKAQEVLDKIRNRETPEDTEDQ